MRVHWELKLPPMAGCQGTYVFREREAFAELLTRAAGESDARRYEKWNAIDFRRQMAILVVEHRWTRERPIQVIGVWKCPSEAIVEVLENLPDPGSVTMPASWSPVASAVVNRCDLPVRFVRRYGNRSVVGSAGR